MARFSCLGEVKFFDVAATTMMGLHPLLRTPMLSTVDSAATERPVQLNGL